MWPSVSSNYGGLRPQKGFHVTQECCGLISCDSVMLWPYATTNCGRFWLDVDYIRPPYGLDKWGSNIPIVTLSLQRNVCILRLKVSTVYIMFSLHKYISKLFFTTIFTLKALRDGSVTVCLAVTMTVIINIQKWSFRNYAS